MRTPRPGPVPRLKIVAAPFPTASSAAPVALAELREVFLIAGTPYQSIVSWWALADLARVGEPARVDPADPQTVVSQRLVNLISGAVEHPLPDREVDRLASGPARRDGGTPS